MKQYVDLSLLALLIIFMYETPAFLIDIVNNTLGKLVLLGAIIFLLYKFGNTSGILAALIFVLILHKRHEEGFEIRIAATREGATGSKGMSKKNKVGKKNKEGMSKKKKKGSKTTEGMSKKKKNKSDGGESDGGESDGGESDGGESDGGESDGDSVKDSKEGFKNFGNSNNLKLNDLEDVNTVERGINFRNRTDLDRELKVNAEKNKIKATSARVDGTM